MQSNHRRLLCFVLLLSFSSFGLAACSNTAQATHLTTIAIISSSTAFDPVVPGFKAAMASAGFVEGQSIQYVYHGVINSDAATVDQEIQTLASHNPDVYLVLGTVPALRIKSVLQKTNKAGIFAPVINPEKLGLVQDLLKPGGSMTGINTGGPFTTRAFEWFLTVASTVKRVHVFYLHGEAQAPTQLPDMQQVADKLNVTMVKHEVNSPSEIMPIVATFTANTDGIFLPVTQLIFVPHGLDFIVPAAQQGIPVGSSANTFPGLVTAATTDYTLMGSQAARLAQEIIHGADVGTLPVESAQYSLEVNLGAAETLGLTVPANILKRADTIVRANPTAVPTATVPPVTFTF